MNSRTIISIAIGLILTVFGALLFYHIVVSSADKFSGLAIVGLLSLLFALIGYMLYAFVGVHRSIQGFVWGYYAFGFLSLFYSVVVLKFNIAYLLGLLIMLVVSLTLIRWRVGSVHAVSAKERSD